MLLSRDDLEFIQTWNDLGNEWPWEVEVWRCLEARSCNQLWQGSETSNKSFINKWINNEWEAELIKHK